MAFKSSKGCGLVGALCLLLVAGSASAQSRTAGAEKGARLLQPFDYRGVVLEEGPLKRQFDEVRYDYLRIPDDALLKGFRQRAGLPAPGVDLGGWYSSDTFHVFGQILSGLARMYAATGDPACKQKAERLLKGWMDCIAPDGYFFYSKSPNARHYIYDKMVGGLVDLILYCDSAPARVALRRITDWAEQNLSRKRGYAFNAGSGDTEWYTLSENLYRAYLATGETRYRDFAAVWEYTEYWDQYAHKASIFAVRPNGQQTGGYHAYSHVNTLGGLGAAYLVKGDRRYLETLENAYDSLQATQCFATGGYGPNELLLPREGLERLLGETHNTFETQCGSWAGFKMSKYLVTCTGDARYGDWVERLILNGIGASISMTPDGRVMYYSDYNPGGGFKRNTDFGWSCCTGTRPMAVADYHDLIYFQAPDTLAVNLYTPSQVAWHVGKTAVTLQQATQFPETDRVAFTVTTAHTVPFTLALRVPGWLSGPMTATVNGKSVALSPDRLHWARLKRTWKSGDHVIVHLPMRLHIEAFDPAKPYPAALLYGPVVLAFNQKGQGRGKREEGRESTQAPEQRTPNTEYRIPEFLASLEPVTGAPLTFRSTADPALVARPFYAFQEGEPYVLTLDPSAANRLSYQTLTFSDGWNDSGQFRFTNRIGATVEATFEGTGIRWLGFRYDDAGRAEVRIDDKVVATVDQYGPGRELSFDWRQTGLAPGKHTIHITLLPDKSPESKDHYINVAGLEILENR